MFEDGLRFEADLVYYPQRPEWFRYLRTIWIVAFLFAFMFLIISKLTDSDSSTAAYSFALVALLAILPFVFRLIQGRYLEVVGKLIIDEKQITTNDNTFPLEDLELVSVNTLKFEGQKFDSDDSPDSGENIIILTHGLKKLEYAFILKDVWHVVKLKNFIPKINESIDRELFVIHKPWYKGLPSNSSSDWRNHV